MPCSVPLWRCSAEITPNTSTSSAAGSHRRRWPASPFWLRVWFYCACCPARRKGEARNRNLKHDARSPLTSTLSMNLPLSRPADIPSPAQSGGEGWGEGVPLPPGSEAQGTENVQGAPFPLPSSPSFLRPFLLAGPTAVGKSELALLLAEKIGGEIISVDSMQVYRGLDIGTAKPSAIERARVPHHLIDVVEVTEPFDAAQFARLAHQAAAQIQARGRVPILCGGTGLYFKAFLEGLGDAPPADAA